MSTLAYNRISATDVPSGLRWDIPARLAGQLMEVAYATPGAKYIQDDGAAYKRVTDRTGGEGAVQFFRYAAVADEPTAPFRVVGRTSGIWEGDIDTLPKALRSLREANQAGLQAALYDAQDRRVDPMGRVVDEIA